MLVAAVGALCGCPQLLRDEFRIGDSVADPTDPEASGGSRNNVLSSNSTIDGTGGGQDAVAPSRDPAQQGSVGGEAAAGGSSDPAARETEGARGAGRNDGARAVGGGGGSEQARATQPERGGGNASAGGSSTGGRPTTLGGAAGAPAATGSASGAGGSKASGGEPADAGASAAADGGEEILDCTREAVMRSPLIAAFDDWNGEPDLYRWRFVFNKESAGVPVTGTFGFYSDRTGDFSLDMVQGMGARGYAVSATNSNASSWGGGVQLLLHCVDASAYTGLQFSIKGFSPRNGGQFEVSVAETVLDTEYKKELPLTGSSWTRCNVPFKDLKNGNESFSGRHIVGVRFSSQLNWVPISATDYGPDPSRIEITVDSVGFY